MNRTGRFASGQILTTGEKALIVMLAAGFIGYWAGFNLSSPGVAVGLPAATAASLQVAAPPAHEALAPRSGAPTRDVVLDDPPIPTF